MTKFEALLLGLTVVPLLFSLATDAEGAPRRARWPRKPDKGKPPGAPEYEAAPRPSDGRDMALTVRKLRDGLDPDRPFLIWAIGSSYTNMLGNGDPLADLIRKRFPNAPKIVYKKMVGNSAPWQYSRGWARHLVIPDQPDLVLIYTIGKPKDLDRLIAEIRRASTADIVVPSIHWRVRDKKLWGKSERAVDQDVAQVRAICKKYGVEFVENRKEWAEYLKANNLQIEDLLKDAVHQSRYGAKVINMNIARHVNAPGSFAYDAESRERRLQSETDSVGADRKQWRVTGGRIRSAKKGARLEVKFTGNRIDLIGVKSPKGGSAKVLIDGKPADEAPVFFVGYVTPNKNNHSAKRTDRPRDQSPHGVTLGKNIVPQKWTITMTSDDGNYKLVGNVAGPDGEGNASKPFTSNSGQIIIEPDLWRRAEKNRTGDTFTVEVYRCALGEVSFKGQEGERFRAKLVQNMANGPHTLEIVANGDGDVAIDAFDVFEPPLK